MRIGLISDTRVMKGEDVPEEVVMAFQGVDLILHAGGIFTSVVLDMLERIAPVKAAGRMQGGQAERPEPYAMENSGDPRVALQQVLELEGHTIGLVNEMWLPGLNDELMPGVIEAHHLPEQALPKLLEEYFGTAVDIVVLGRTLYAMVEEHQGILFINPGSPTLPKNLVKLGSVAILELTQESREVRMIDLVTVTAAKAGT
jgi:putative phosphoesterase